MKLYMFRTVTLSIIRSSSLYTQQWYMSANPYDIHHCCVYSDDGQRNCPKHVEFHSKNKSEKLVHLVGFIMQKLFPLFYLSLIYLFTYTTQYSVNRSVNNEL